MKLQSFDRKQRGAALVVSLIILLIMTVIGVTSMRGSVLEEKMAGNARQAMVASHAAEASLRAGETWIIANVKNPGDLVQFSNGTLGLYSQRDPLLLPGFDIYDDSAWAGNSVSVGLTGIIPPGGLKNQLVSQDPAYIVEYIGRVGPPPLNYDKPDPRQYAFRITAIGWGEDANAHFLAESYFHKEL